MEAADCGPSSARARGWGNLKKFFQNEMTEAVKYGYELRFWMRTVLLPK
jgi:hypothetical protein